MRSPWRSRLEAFRDRVARRLLGVSRSEVRALSARLDELADEAKLLRATSARETELARSAATDASRRLADEIDRLRQDATAHLRQLTEGQIVLDARLLTTATADRLERAERHSRIVSTMAWIRQADVPDDLLVTVILASRDRGALLPRAIRSVLGQSYPRKELVVVDDGSGDDTPEVLATFAAQGVRTVRTDGVGASAARNRGLEEATGDAVTYLDDDNVMHPDWLRSVAWAFARRPDTEVVYGARLVDAPSLLGERDEGPAATVQFEPFDRRRLEQGNFIDLGVIAHRAGLTEAWFDEDLITQSDWDLVLRLTRDRAPVALPALACLYTTSAPDRLSDHAGLEEEAERIRARTRNRGAS
jgi:Glycosyl transferase family 2